MAMNQKASGLCLSQWVPGTLVKCHTKLPDSGFPPNPDSASNLINHTIHISQCKLEIGVGMPQRQGQNCRCERQQQDKAVKTVVE